VWYNGGMNGKRGRLREASDRPTIMCSTRETRVQFGVPPNWGCPPSYGFRQIRRGTRPKEFWAGRQNHPRDAGATPDRTWSNPIAAIMCSRYTFHLCLNPPAKREKLASQARHESVAPQELFASRTVVWIIVKYPDSSYLNRVSHRVIFRRNRALSCYIVLRIRNLFFEQAVAKCGTECP